jgi:predicted DNA-binding transcriptional regulator AlpA
MNEDDKTNADSLLTRRELARRWKVSIETLKRRERTKIPRPMRLDGRIVRYRMSDVVRIEQQGSGK